VSKNAAEMMTLIEPWGDVFPCNTQSKGPCGNVYAKTYFTEVVQSMNDKVRDCFSSKRCGAFLTASIMEHICG
jgi:MoaA/NifB/PqqE/SkfB family radical SAM enzyme